MKTKRKENGEDEILTTLKDVKVLLQDLLIMQGLRAGMQGEDVRQMMKLRLERVTHISKRLKKAKKENRA